MNGLLGSGCPRGRGLPLRAFGRREAQTARFIELYLRFALITGAKQKFAQAGLRQMPALPQLCPAMRMLSTPRIPPAGANFYGSVFVVNIPSI
jgi:hypothetical protein